MINHYIYDITNKNFQEEDGLIFLINILSDVFHSKHARVDTLITFQYFFVFPDFIEKYRDVHFYLLKLLTRYNLLPETFLKIDNQIIFFIK